MDANTEIFEVGERVRVRQELLHSEDWSFIAELALACCGVEAVRIAVIKPTPINLRDRHPQMLSLTTLEGEPIPVPFNGLLFESVQSEQPAMIWVH